MRFPKRQLILVLILIGHCWAATAVINSFNAGELSPLLYGRSDVARYFKGCQTLENMIVMAQGGVTKRPGSYYIASAKSSSVACRLIPFEYSITQAYIIEVGHEYMRFYRNGGRIEVDALAYEITTPYDGNDIFEIQFIQSADTMYLVHNLYAPRSLTRSDHTSWTLTAISFSRGPFLEENETATTITPSATTGTITLTASAATFASGHVGALWQVTHTVDAVEVSGSFTDLASDTASSTQAVQLGRKYDFTTHGTWTGTVLLQRSYDAGSNWKDEVSFTNGEDGNISWAQSETEDNAIYRVLGLDALSGTCNYTLLVYSHDIDGVAQITVVTDSTHATATVTNTLGSTGATSRWSEGAWSLDEGYPSCVAFYEERLAFAATDNMSQTIWFSQTDDWDNFLAGSDDTDAITLTIASDQVNAIRWMVAQSRLLLGTLGGEWTLSASQVDEPLTPTNLTAKRQSSYGSANIQALAMNNMVVFVQRQLRKVRKLQYSFELDNWIAPDLTILSNHITGDGIVDLALQKNPNPILWGVRTDGTLIGLTLEESQEVIGWHRHDLDGDVESVAVIPGTNEDEVWIEVERTIDSSTVRYIEQIQPTDWGDDQEDCFFVDSGLSYDGGAAVTITGVTQADPAVVTATAHGLSEGVQVRIASVSGMTELNDNVYTLGLTATDTFALRDRDNRVDINSSGFTAYTSGGTATQVENTFATLAHLEGETVTVVGDGGYVGTEVVSSRKITLDDFYNTVHVGLGYTARLQPMRLEMPTTPGALFGKTKRITEVTIRFYESLGCKIGTSWTDYDSFVFRDADDPLETAPPLFTGDKKMEFAGDYETAGNLYIQDDEPLPLTVLSLIATFEVYP